MKSITLLKTALFLSTLGFAFMPTAHGQAAAPTNGTAGGAGGNIIAGLNVEDSEVNLDDPLEVAKKLPGFQEARSHFIGRLRETQPALAKLAEDAIAAHHWYAFPVVFYSLPYVNNQLSMPNGQPMYQPNNLQIFASTPVLKQLKPDVRERHYRHEIIEAMIGSESPKAQEATELLAGFFKNNEDFTTEKLADEMQYLSNNGLIESPAFLYHLLGGSEDIGVIRSIVANTKAAIANACHSNMEPRAKAELIILRLLNTDYFAQLDGLREKDVDLGHNERISEEYVDLGSTFGMAAIFTQLDPTQCRINRGYRGVSTLDENCNIQQFCQQAGF